MTREALDRAKQLDAQRNEIMSLLVQLASGERCGLGVLFETVVGLQIEELNDSIEVALSKYIDKIGREFESL